MLNNEIDLFEQFFLDFGASYFVYRWLIMFLTIVINLKAAIKVSIFRIEIIIFLLRIIIY